MADLLKQVYQQLVNDLEIDTLLKNAVMGDVALNYGFHLTYAL